MPWSLPKFISLSTIALAACSLGACGASNVVGAGADGGGNPGDGDASAWIAGSWTGTFKLKDEDSESMSATAKFTVTDERAGSFTITLPDNDTAAIEGKFQDFAGETLVLTVKKSSISSLGNDTSTSNLDYDLIGDSLKLQNERALLRLVRAKTDDDKTDDGEPTPQTGMTGHWGCQDTNGYLWAIQIKSETEFSADVTTKNGSRAPIWLDGSVAKIANDAEYDARLTVTDSDVTKYVGMELGFNQTSTDAAEFTRLGDGGQLMSCTRTK